MSMCVSREARTGLCAKRDRLFLVLERGQAVCVRGRILDSVFAPYYITKS